VTFAYYNDNDPFIAQWLRNLIARRLIAAGDVDERNICDVQINDVKEYTQCHFFAGIGGWSLALRLAGWHDDRPVWTGSCPCQPLSSAGQRQGHADERHLWPAFYRLIAECRPATIFGEQVASALGREWLAGVRADLEDLGYAVGAADLCAAGVGAPHIRQRLFWVADTKGERPGWRAHDENKGRRQLAPVDCDAGASGLALATGGRRRSEWASKTNTEDRSLCAFDRSDAASRLGDATGAGCQGQRGEQGAGGLRQGGQSRPSVQDGVTQWNGPTIALRRADGWARIAAEPALFPVASRLPGDVGRLRAAGNAIVPQVAAEFIAAFMECQP
jgi:DNA (cytosine-5)-methyltransferase 1